MKRQSIGERGMAYLKTTESNWQRLRSLIVVFSRLGAIGFGGPLAHIGLMEDECVVRREWMSREVFLEGLAICNLLPGPTSTQLSIYLGYVRAGAVGGLTSGACFIVPAFVVVLVLSWAYFQYGTLPVTGAFFVGIAPVVVAIILNTTYRSSKTALTMISSWLLAIFTCIFTLVRLLPLAINLVTILLISGLVGMLLYGRISGSSSPPAGSDRPKQKSTIIKSIAPLLAMGRLFHSLPVDASLLVVLALEFFKIGLLMFGGGLVIAPLLQQELVDSQHWLTTKQLLDGIALGQLTPGPVTVVATFAGYATAGFAGGLVATVAVFLPAFILVLGLSPVLLRVRDVPLVKGFLKGITAGALGAIAAAAIIFARAAIFDVVTLAIAFVSLLLLIRWNINTIVLIAGAAIVGLLRLFL